MDKQVRDFEVENMLENWHKKPLESTAMLAAKTRIWSKISNKTLDLTTNSPLSNLQNQSNMSSENLQNTSNSTQSSTSNKPKNPKPWFLQPLNLSLISLALILIVGGGAGLAYLNQSNQKLNQQIALQKEAQNSKTSLNPISKTDLSLDQIRGLATIKLSNYTNGASLDEIQNSILKKVDSAAIGGLGSAGGQSATMVKNETSTVNAPTPEDLVKEKGIADKVVYYTQNLVTESDAGYSYTYLKNAPGFDPKKPIKSQSWTSANYSKSVVSQDGKIFSYYIYGPDFSVDFRGGKYAIKEVFDQKQYLSGFSQDSGNTELSFLKSILSDATLKDSGRQVIDGKSYKVLETDLAKVGTDPSFAGSGNADLVATTRYYVDTDKLSVFRTEYYTNKVLVSSSTQTDYQEYKNPNLTELFGVADLGQTELKTVKSSAYDDSLNLNQLSQANKIAAIYIPRSATEIELKSNLGAFDASAYSNTEITKLRHTRDFDPSLDDALLKSLLNPAIVSYSLSAANTTINTAIFKSPITKEENLNIKLQRNQTIKLDGKDSPAVYKEVFYGDGSSQGVGVQASLPDSDISYRLEFQTATGLWYQISEFQPYAPVGQKPAPSILQSKNIDLVSLTPDQISKIDSFQKERQASYPELDFETKLEDLVKNNRILPGDLSKTFKIELSGITKSKKLGSSSICEKFLATGWALNDCLLEKYNGFSLNFYQKFDPNSASLATDQEQPNDLTFSVLNIKLENLDLAKYVETIKQNTPLPATNVTISVSGNAQVKEFKHSDDYSNNTSYFAAFQDKTIVLSSSKLTKAQLLDIAAKSGLDKDLNLLIEQFKQSRLPSPEPKPLFDLNK